MKNQLSRSGASSLPFWLTIGAMILTVIGIISLGTDRLQFSNSTFLLLAVTLVIVFVAALLLGRQVRREGVSVPGGPARIHYIDKDVTAGVPWQGFAVQILRIPSSPLEETLGDHGNEFTPTEILLNVVVARLDDSDKLVTHFDPRFDLQLPFSRASLEKAKKQNLPYPQFGFWDGCKWVLFTEKKHGLKYLSVENPTEQVAGYASVSLSEWSDPMIGRGP